MLFSSSVFLFAFLPLTLLVYFLVPERMAKVRNLVLLIASLFNWLRQDALSTFKVFIDMFR